MPNKHKSFSNGPPNNSLSQIGTEIWKEEKKRFSATSLWVTWQFVGLDRIVPSAPLASPPGSSVAVGCLMG
jgi:hypothetical protein